MHAGPSKNSGHIADNHLKWIFVNETWIFIQISLKFIPDGPIDDKCLLNM